MPTKPRAEDTLIEFFLSAYERGTWFDSKREPLDRLQDGAVEMRATRVDGRSVAIEHTLIESFIGEREDFERFRRFLPIQSDPSLVLQGKLIDVNVPRGILAKGLDWESVVESFHRWLRGSIHSFPEGQSTQLCRIKSDPPIDVAVEVTVRIGGEYRDFGPLIRRYGEVNVPDTVQKALKAKLPKLVKTKADIRILLLERNQWTLDEKEIHSEIEKRRSSIPDLNEVDVWIVETVTASADRMKGYVEFKLYRNGKKVETFAFHNGALTRRSENGMPVVVP